MDNLLKVNCTNCDLCIKRKNIVHGYGNIKSKLVFIGEAPGYHEDKTGKPFVGKAGVLLEIMLNHFNFNFDDLFFTNVVRCRPQLNNTPNINNIKSCLPFLIEEINDIKPEIIVLLGSTALRTMFNKFNINIQDYRGFVIQHNNIKILPMLHPSNILMKPDLLNAFYTDFCTLNNLYKQIDIYHGLVPKWSRRRI